MTEDRLPDSEDATALRHGGVGDVTGGVRSAITDPRGAIHAGDGNLYSNSFHIAAVNISGLAPDPTVRQPLGIKPGQASIQFLHRVFVEPEGFDGLRGQLSQPGSTAVLTGMPGSGRRAAAQMLLCPTAEDVGALTLLTTSDLEGNDRLTADAVSEGARLLLDVSDLDLRSFVQHQADLQRCVSIVSQQRATLVILIPDGVDRYLHDDLQVHRRSIRRPDQWRVLLSHLEFGFDLALSRSAVARDDLQTLNELPLRSVARVAGYLEQTHDQRLEPGDWFRNALTGLADQEQDVITLLSQRTSVEQRTLLLVTAVLEGASVDAIYFAERSLQEIVKYAEESPPHRLAQSGITDRIRSAGDEIRLVDGTARFVRPGQGEAILSHFWDAYPDLRSRFADWVRAGYNWRATRAEDRMMVARRFAVQSIRTNRLNDLLRVVEHWSAVGREETRRLAIEAMTSALLDDLVAPQARQYLYSLATRANLEPAMGRLAIELCTDVVAIGHPRQALIRLRWLVDRGEPVGNEAKKAIVALCEDNRTLELFVHVLTDRERFDPGLARHVVAPRRLTTGRDRIAPLLVPRLQQKAVTVWRRSLQPLDAPSWRYAITPWLDEHADRIEQDQSLLAALLRRTLIELCDGDIARLAQLNTANENWLAQRSRASSGQALIPATAVEKALDRAFADLPSTPLENPS